MPGFFRGKRAEAVAESSSGRYLRYAIGEIFLIFVGITLALWFNNWNDQRQLRELELATLSEIAGNLRVNIDSLQANITRDENSFLDCQQIIELLDSRKAWLDEHSSIVSSCRTWTSPFFQDAAYESLRLRGSDLISDQLVRYSIINLYENVYAFLIGDVDRMQWGFESSVWSPIYVRHMEHQGLDNVQPSNYDELAQSSEFRNALYRHMSLLDFSINAQQEALAATRETLDLVEPEEL